METLLRCHNSVYYKPYKGNCMDNIQINNLTATIHTTCGSLFRVCSGTIHPVLHIKRLLKFNYRYHYNYITAKGCCNSTAYQLHISSTLNFVINRIFGVGRVLFVSITMVCLLSQSVCLTPCQEVVEEMDS